MLHFFFWKYSDVTYIASGGRELDDVILVGGATRMPCILRLVRTITGVGESNPNSVWSYSVGGDGHHAAEPRRSVNPDEAVCQGAGIWAGILDGIIDDVQVATAGDGNQ